MAGSPTDPGTPPEFLAERFCEASFRTRTATPSGSFPHPISLEEAIERNPAVQRCRTASESSAAAAEPTATDGGTFERGTFHGGGKAHDVGIMAALRWVAADRQKDRQKLLKLPSFTVASTLTAARISRLVEFYGFG